MRGRSRHSRDTGPGAWRPGPSLPPCPIHLGSNVHWERGLSRGVAHREKDSGLILEVKGEQTIGSYEIMKCSGTHGWAQGAQEASAIAYIPVLGQGMWASTSVAFSSFSKSLTALRPSSEATLEKSLTATLLPAPHLHPTHRAPKTPRALPPWTQTSH